MADYINNEREQEKQNAIETGSSNLIGPIAAGLGTIGLGISIFAAARRGPRSLVPDLLHYLGHGRAVGLSKTLDQATKAPGTRGIEAGVRSLATSQIDTKRNILRLGPIDLIDDVRVTVETVDNSLIGIGSKLTARTNEWVHRRNIQLGPFNSFFGHDLQRVTVGEVLSDSNTWMEFIGKNQFDTLIKAERIGAVSRETFLDSSIYKNRLGEIRDLRLRSILGPESKIGKFTGGIDLFGQVGVFRSLIGSRRNVAILGETAEIKGNRFFVGGNVYGYNRQGKEFLLEKNVKLRLSGDPLDSVTAARKGEISVDETKLKEAYSSKRLSVSMKSALMGMEKKTRIGTSFAVRPSFIDRWIINPLLRYSSLRKGTGTVYKHQYGVKGATGKIVDMALGGELPELISNRGVIERVKGGGREVPLAQLGLLDRLAVLFDLKKDVSVVSKTALAKRATGRYTLSNKDLIVPLPEGGLKSLSKTIRGRLGENLTDVQRGIVTKAGDVISTPKAKFYTAERSRVIPGITSVRDFANYLFYRVNSLASETGLGIGFAPGSNALVSAMRLATIPLVYEAGREAVEYVDYLTEKITGVSPKKFVASLYTTARVFQQRIREGIGVQPTLSSLEENFPGSVDSEGASIIRSAGIPLGILATTLGGPKAKLGAAMAGAFYLLFGGPKPGESSEELEAEYRGEKKVPIRRGRFWGMGFGPLGGSTVDYYDFNWYYKLKNDLAYVGNYGSKEEYFQYHQNVFGIPLPTPSNALGLSNILNPYRWEEKNFEERPYAATGSQLENLPIFGPILGATIGKALKPTVYRYEDLPLLRANLVDKGLDPSTAQMLGIPMRDASAIEIEDPHNPKQRLKKMIDVGLEPLGIYKFALQYYGVTFSPSGGPRLATSDIATSEGREFYGQQLGGLAGETELARRYMLSDYYSPHNVGRLLNPIPNQMPDFLPGVRSRYDKDREYMQDFHSGDPMTRIPKGEYRLPGKAYALANKIHSNIEGELDEVDRFLILADVAPYSQGYSTLEKKVKEMKLDDYWSGRVEEAIAQRNERIGPDTRYPRYLDDLTNINEATKDSAMYKEIRNAYDTVTHDFLAEIPYFGSKLFPFRSPYEQYRKMYVEGADYASWETPYENIVRPMYYDVALANPLMAAMKGATIAGLLHGPMRLFSPFKSVEGSLSSNLLVGASVGAGLSLERISEGKPENYIPDHIRRESDVVEYGDKFTYLKNRLLQEEALDQGNLSAASKFERVSRKTMVGANNPIMLRASLPKSTDRRFFDYFSKAQGSLRDQILVGMPEYYSDALKKSYSRNYPSQTESDQSVESYFAVNPLPSESYIGWHPSIPSSANKIKFIQHGINGISDNYHRHGFFESQINELEYRLPDLYREDLDYIPPIGYQSIKDMQKLTKGIRGSLQARYAYSSTSARNNLTVNRDVSYYSQDLLR